MFSLIDLRATDIEYGVRSSPSWILLLLLLIYMVPMIFYWTVRFPSRNDLRKAWTSLTASPTAGTATSPLRGVMAALLHLHRHPKLNDTQRHA